MTTSLPLREVVVLAFRIFFMRRFSSIANGTMVTLSGNITRVILYNVFASVLSVSTIFPGRMLSYLLVSGFVTTRRLPNRSCLDLHHVCSGQAFMVGSPVIDLVNAGVAVFVVVTGTPSIILPIAE